MALVVYIITMFSNLSCLDIWFHAWPVTWITFKTLLWAAPVAFIVLYVVDPLAGKTNWFGSVVVNKLVLIAVVLMLFFSSVMGVETWVHWQRGSVPKTLCDKIEYAHIGGVSHAINGLTMAEYHVLQQFWSVFPDIPTEASNTGYVYGFSHFGDEGALWLGYDLPEEIPIDTFEYVEGDLMIWQRYKVKDGIKRISYGYELE